MDRFRWKVDESLPGCFEPAGEFFVCRFTKKKGLYFLDIDIGIKYKLPIY